jgi:hypothetical protein
MFESTLATQERVFLLVRTNPSDTTLHGHERWLAYHLAKSALHCLNEPWLKEYHLLYFNNRRFTILRITEIIKVL